MECTIFSADSWSCTIHLRISGRRDEQFSPVLTSKSDVELWIRRAQGALLCYNYLPIATFKNKSREQIKELTDPEDARVLTLTNDIVVVTITDPSGANLSFVDLPGARRTLPFQVCRRNSGWNTFDRTGRKCQTGNVRIGEQSRHRLHVASFYQNCGSGRPCAWCVRSLLIRIELILTSRLDDLDNPKALRFAREADPKGKRTICA